MKRGLDIWVVYFITILLTVYIHEVGHCIPAWIHGYWAVPTPAKEYISVRIPANLFPYISLGGVMGTIISTITVLVLYQFRTHRFGSSILAGAIVTPGFYTLRFILVGRGHDSTEFQEAQSALGFSYPGHSLDWVFVILFLLGIAVWIIKSKPNYRITGRLLIGFVLTIIFIVGLQKINNAVFDPLFKSESIVHKNKDSQ